jgi:hypothetical protein
LSVLRLRALVKFLYIPFRCVTDDYGEVYLEVYVHGERTPRTYTMYVHGDVRGVRTPMNYVITMPISDWLAVFNGEYR